ncbi:MAG TPA: VWA domain-containing protein [Candidatus Methanofastidiosa archaeon]|nr:VWA domain-containing protein [Candidatus Methanofastidiosa archaeon]HPR42534.1 VWA domain-containing protein [Candidatus Methanofastidiosa archaeon]
MEPSIHTIEGDYLDTLDYEKSREIDLVIGTLRSGKEIYAHAEELYHDIFMLLHTINPKERLVPPSRLEDSAKLNRRIIDELLKKDTTDDLRLQNGGMYFMSALGAASLLETVMRWMEGNNDVKLDPDDGEKIFPESALENLYDAMENAPVENMVSRGLEMANIKVSKERDIAQAIERAFGKGMSEKLKFDIAQKMSNDKCYSLIIKMLERLRFVAHEARRKKFNKGHSINRGYEYSNNLERVLPVEMSLLKGDKSRPLFFKKYHDNKLQCIKYQKKDLRKSGPIIACVDNSGSMEGMPEAYSKAVMILLYEQALKQRRQFIVLHFSSKDKIERFDFDIGKRELEKLVGAIEFYAGGGTDFETPLKRAIDIVIKGRYRGTDLIFVSDGFSEISPSFLEEFLSIKRECDINVLAVGIKEGIWKRHTLDSFSDCTIPLPDINDENLQNRAVEEIFVNMR